MQSDAFTVRLLSLPQRPEEARHAYHVRLREQAHRLAEGMLPSADWAKGTHGKPFLPGHPLFFNLTHCAGLAACVTGALECGIDAEPLTRAPGRVIQKVCTPQEQAFVDAHGVPAFFRLWTLKEAFVKCTGDGISFPLRTVCFTAQEEQLTFTRTGYAFWQWVSETHVVSLCARLPEAEARPIEVQPLALPQDAVHTLKVTIRKD